MSVGTEETRRLGLRFRLAALPTPPFEEPRRVHVAPDQSRFGGRRRTRGQCADPGARRTLKAAREQLRVGREQVAISVRGADDPHDVDRVLMPVADGYGECLSLGTLPVRRPDRRIDVAERVHALDLHEATISCRRLGLCLWTATDRKVSSRARRCADSLRLARS